MSESLNPNDPSVENPVRADGAETSVGTQDSGTQDSGQADKQVVSTEAVAKDDAEEVSEKGADEEKSQHAKPRAKKNASRKDRMPYLIIACLTVLTVFAANGAWTLFVGNSDTESETQPEPTELIAEQIELVKAGKSDTIEISKAIITDEELAMVRDLEDLKILILDAGIISDAGMEPLSTLVNLVHLRIRNSLITDIGIKHLLGLENLRILNLPQANLTPDGMLSLAQLKGLRQLRIGGDGTTDLSRSVAQLHNLRALHLIDIPVSDEGLRGIAKLPRLESLYLDNARITEVGWQWLFNTHPEIHVHINQRHHDTDPNWHLHNLEQDADDMESQGAVTEESEKVLKAWENQKKEAEKEEDEPDEPSAPNES